MANPSLHEGVVLIRGILREARNYHRPSSKHIQNTTTINPTTRCLLDALLSTVMAMRCLVVAGILFAQAGRASPGLLPTPTAAGLNVNYGEIELLPTSYPGSPSELFRRLNGDPAICGWVEGNAGELLYSLAKARLNRN